MNTHILIAALTLIFMSTTAHSGVIGVGNSGDLSMQLGFAKTAAVLSLENVGFEKLEASAIEIEQVEFYKKCRETMFIGAINTKFELVDRIDDSDGFHAIARRINNKTIQISRRELEKMSDAGSLTGPFLASMVIHEVGHDCVYNGQSVDDTYDTLLNSLAQNLILFSTDRSQNFERQMVFVQRVRENKRVTVVYLPQKLRSELVNQYTDYAGDFAFDKIRHSLNSRPISASRFFETLAKNIFPSWNELNISADQELHLFREQLLRPPQTTKNLSFMQKGRILPLESKLNCSYSSTDSVDKIQCLLKVHWPKNFHNLANGISIDFETNIFGKLSIKKISPMT